MSVVEAMVIGDGCIDSKGRIRLKHSIKQADYLRHKVALLEKDGFKVSVQEFTDERNPYGTREFIRASTTATTRGKDLRRFFYHRGHKFVPESVFERMGWHEWAIVFQDDGRANKISHYNTIRGGKRERVECEPFANRYEFCCPHFSDEEMVFAIASLGSLGVEARTGWHRKLGQRLLWISRAQAKIRFWQGVAPFVVASMRYKLVRPTLACHVKRHTLAKEGIRHGNGLDTDPSHPV